MENYELVRKGFRILLQGLAPYVARELQIKFGLDWWKEGVLSSLYVERIQSLPKSGDWGTLVDSMDETITLNLIDIHWNSIFRKKLSRDHRNWVKELITTRNKLMHLGTTDFNDSDTWRALDTMSRLDEQIDPDGTEEILSMQRKFRYGSTEGSRNTSNIQSSKRVSSKEIGILVASNSELPSWREVIEPHPDVAQGRYKKAEFAADLNQVARGEGTLEYRDPVEFFNRTYVTEGMAGLLIQSLKRITGKDGEPVIQLKTAFGGGKTHSMLALYHLLNGRISLQQLSNLDKVLEEAKVRSLPKANIAVLVGTALNPTKSKRPNDMGGITINTLWGEMAYQLAKGANNPKLYDYVKESDKKGVSPGSEALTQLFNDAGPCLILIDELVAYGKKIYDQNGLPAGNFDNFITFIQEVTEAARASKNSLIVASIPESNIEIGGEAGKRTLEAIEHTFGRMESIWKPVAADEGFEVVRRRLFLECKHPELKEKVCNAFSQLYVENASEFPSEAREVEYRERIISCYPIHPEVFDRLYNDWATLERFQRTRGVLRLMAAVIHELWMGNDGGAMIMPSSIQFSVPSVRDELTRHLSENWNAIVDKEVDGKNSIPYQLDQNQSRYGKYLASRRVSRTIMLGSAPTERGQIIRGIESSRIRLGTVQPGENISIFNDALSGLRQKLQYLYSNSSGDRFWYDTRPTLRKTVEDRATQILSSEIEYEIEKRLKKIQREKSIVGVHITPKSSSDVSDEQKFRLVILPPKDIYKRENKSNNLALEKAKDILDYKGSTSRVYRNMLAFIAPDSEAYFHLEKAVRYYLAWESIKNDSKILNLDAQQNEETTNNLKRNDEIVEIKLKETYSWLLVPFIDEEDLSIIKWNIESIKGGYESIVKKAVDKMIQDELLITQWAPRLLQMELEAILWTDKNDISIKNLWNYLSQYCYLPRLKDYSVLEKTIHNGLSSQEFFGLAAGKSNDRYIDLTYNQEVSYFDKSAFLVKPLLAIKQINEEKTESILKPLVSNENESDFISTNEIKSPQASSSLTHLDSPKTRFSMKAKLDPTRINRDTRNLVEEVIQYLQKIDNATLDLSLEVHLEASNEIPLKEMRTIIENCESLGISDFKFD